MIDQIKELRVRIDGLSCLTKGLKPVDALWDDPKKAPENAVFKHIMIDSKETEKAYDSLILAKAWLGKVLAELGTDSPYKSGYKEVSDIEPTADVQKVPDIIFDLGGKVDDILWKNKSHIEKVDCLRTEIDKLLKELEKIRIERNKTKLVICVTNVFTHLSEARFHLGFELQRIKEQSDKQ
jgi:hypothetical protein